MKEANDQNEASCTRIKVLQVDDEPYKTKLRKLMIEEKGNYEVRTENFPENALEVMREFRPDIVLLDIIMPRMPGGEVLKAIRDDPDLKSTPVVFVTAAVRRQQIEECGGMICDIPTIAEPCTIEELIEAIEKYAWKPQ